ncbi:MAG: hypothetical protein M0R38_04435 [Bacteroidia bacterium]|nr:hypothetical protein [Bacteroidia bacterium]
MQHLLEKYEYISRLLQLEKENIDRREFHKKVAPLLLEMGANKEFLKDVIKRNFLDEGYLNMEWTGYNIPFFYVYETEHFVLKLHLFPPDKEKRNNIAAHCIHHHNNYIITTNAFFGSGYESFLFEKNPQVDSKTLDVDLKITKHFHQRDWNPSMVDSWEPHVVFIPQELSSTLIIWSPDKRRATDNLRQNPLFKLIKKPLRWFIHKTGMTQTFGIAEEKTYQFYPNPNGKGFKGIEENEYFAPTKSEKGEAVNDYSAQMIFAFIQRAGLFDAEFFAENKNRIPAYYHKFIDMVAVGEPIQDVYHRTVINVPQKTYYREDVLKASL